MTCLRLYDRQERNVHPERSNEKDPAYLATFSSSSRRARCAARGLVVVVMVMRINEVIIEVLMGPHGFMHAVTWSSCHGRAGKFSLPACHAAFKASFSMRVMVVAILVRYGQRQEDHT